MTAEVRGGVAQPFSWRARRVATALVTLFCAAALAQPGGGSPRAGLVLSASLEKVVESTAADGSVHVELVAPTRRSVSDSFIYTVRFTNATRGATDGVRITTPVPDGLSYVADSAIGPGSLVLFSVDGGRTFGAERELRVIERDATARLAEAADYTHVRWLLKAPLEAGATGFARFRAIAR